MPGADNTHLQISTLAATYRLLLKDGDISRAQLKGKLIAAQAVMEDGSEINATAFEGGSVNATVMYPKEVVLAAALAVLEESDPDNAAGLLGLDPSVVHADLSHTRIET